MYHVIRNYLLIPQGGLRTAVQTARRAGHRASDWRTFYHGLPKKFLSTAQKQGLVPRSVIDISQIKSPQLREGFLQQRGLMAEKGMDVDYKPNIFVGSRETVAGHVVHRIGETLGQRQRIIYPQNMKKLAAARKTAMEEPGLTSKLVLNPRQWAFLKVRVPKGWPKPTFRSEGSVLELEKFNPLIGAYAGERVISRRISPQHLRVVPNEQIYPSIARMVHRVKTSPGVLGVVKSHPGALSPRVFRYPYQEISRQIGGKWIPGVGFKKLRLSRITPGVIQLSKLGVG